jgi:hypothetical protein
MIHGALAPLLLNREPGRKWPHTRCTLGSNFDNARWRFSWFLQCKPRRVRLQQIPLRFSYTLLPQIQQRWNFSVVSAAILQTLERFLG